MSSASSFLRGLSKLTVGTIAVQGAAAALQFLLAVWLTPDQFGLWAAAIGAMTICSGLVNFGEVNGLLANPARRYRDALRAARRFNSCLTIVGLGIASAYAFGDRSEVAVLIALNALLLPVIGSSRLAYAALMRPRAYRAAVVGQGIGSLARVAVGVSVAVTTGSAIAFACALCAYSIVSRIVFGVYLRSRSGGIDATSGSGSHVAFGLRDRSSWGIQSFVQYLPTQVDYFVVSLVASPAFLGVYFLAYQVTAAVSGFVISPLSKSFLAALSAAPEEKRSSFAAEISLRLLALVTLASCGIILVMDIVAGYIPGAWRDVVPLTAILAASLPARFLVPVTDALLMAGARWRASIILHGLDTLGTAGAALIAVTGDSTALVLAIVVWKIVYATTRLFIVDPRERGGVVSTSAVLLGMSGLMIVAGVLPELRFGLTLLSAGTAGVLLYVVSRRFRV